MLWNTKYHIFQIVRPLSWKGVLLLPQTTKLWHVIFLLQLSKIVLYLIYFQVWEMSSNMACHMKKHYNYLPYLVHCLSCLPSTKLAREAVTRLLAHSRKAWSSSNLLVLIPPITTATTEPRNPTTIAWH